MDITSLLRGKCLKAAKSEKYTLIHGEILCTFNKGPQAPPPIKLATDRSKAVILPIFLPMCYFEFVFHVVFWVTNFVVKYLNAILRG